MAKIKTLDDLFLDTLKDIYYAERKILKALPKMKRAATNENLVAAFDKHHGETEEHPRGGGDGAQDQRLEQHGAAHLPAGGPHGSQQCQVPGALGH